jgi:hypothetical protein
VNELTQYRRWFASVLTDFVTEFVLFYGQNFIQCLRNMSCLVTHSIHEIAS